MHEDIDVRDVRQLPLLKGELLSALQGVASQGHAAAGSVASLTAMCRAEVARRRHVLERCLASEERNCNRERLAWERSLRALQQAESLNDEASGVAWKLQKQADELAHRTAVKLSALHQHLSSAPPGPPPTPVEAGTPPQGPSGVSSGGGSSVNASAPGLEAPGHLPAEAPRELADAIRAYADHGAELNGALWDAEASGWDVPAETASLSARLDSAFRVAAPTTSWMTLNRSTSIDLIQDLVGGDGSDEAATKSALDLGPACLHPAFLSASEEDPFSSVPDYRVHLRVHVPAGSAILDLRAKSVGGTGLSKFSNEREFLLPRGGHLLVIPGATTAIKRNGMTHWYLDMLYVR